jgi:hypothetical protein
MAIIICDNCSTPAEYTNADPGANPINYCVACLPSWLHDRAQAGHFPLVAPITEEAPAESKSSAKRKAVTKSVDTQDIPEELKAATPPADMVAFLTPVEEVIPTAEVPADESN